MKQVVEKIVGLFETLTPQSVERLSEFYTAETFFKDPFNEVRGVQEVQRIFGHMFDVLHEPRFVITERLVDGEQCFLSWDFRFRFKKFKPDVNQTIRGATHLKLAPDGRICFHRDYWDAAEEMYEKLPVIGGLMRWLKKRVNS